MKVLTRFWTIAILLGISRCVAQDADTVIMKDSPQAFTVLSRVDDPQERQAFTAIYKATNSANRHSLAKGFIEKYPQSWVLAQAFDLAARSSIDLGAEQQALDEGRFSLRLLPENPVLLVLMANLQARRGLYQQAEVSARDALEYLDESESGWNGQKSQLKASAYFALGRSFAARSLVSKAADALNRAAALNPNDPEIAYLQKLVRSAGGDPAPFVTPLEQSSKAIREGYAGPSACRTCHTREYDTWRQTGMSKMLREYKPENVIGDFSPGSQFKNESGNVLVKMGFDKRPHFDVADAAGKWHRFSVDYTIGSKWQQGYATKLPDGAFHVLPIEYNVIRKAWINYWKMIDPPGSPRADISAFPKLLPETNYQQNCAICHTSQLRAWPDSDKPMEHAVFLEPGVDCEMCHGPSAWHIKHPRKEDSAEPPVNFKKVSNRVGVSICAQCHRQSAVREFGERQEMNYSTSGNTFVQKSWVRPYDAFSRRAFYKDGRFRETTFIVEAFTRSACYRIGTAQCATCHAPHVPDFASNFTSLKFKSNPNEMCLQCHDQFREKLSRHTHHEAGSEASQCVSCHMPRIMEALMFQARSHEIGIPSADLAQRFGQAESPNACLICHAGKSPDWAAQRLTKW